MAATKARRLTGVQREQQLLDVAEELFADRGFEGVSMEDVARAAGISRPIVYQHHGSREGLFIACVRRSREEFEATLIEATAAIDGDLDAVIAAGGRVFFDLIADNPRRWALLFSTSASLGGDMAEQLLELRQHTIDRIADVAEQHTTGVDRSLLLASAHVTSGIGEQLGRWWLNQPNLELADALRVYVVAVGGAVQGLLSLHESAPPT